LGEKYKIEYTPRMEKALHKLGKEDKGLFAEVYKKMEAFEKGEFEKLVIKPIKRNKAKHQISEIVVKSPASYRIFYVVIDTENNTAVFADGKRKKKRKFSSTYFSQLDDSLDIYLSRRDKNE